MFGPPEQGGWYFLKSALSLQKDSKHNFFANQPISETPACRKYLARFLPTYVLFWTLSIIGSGFGNNFSRSQFLILKIWRKNSLT